MGVCFLCLLGRAFELQVLEADDYRKDLATKRRALIVLKAARGRILDRNGRVLAYDERAFDLHVVLEDFLKDDRGVEKLARLLEKPAEEVEAAVAKNLAAVERIVARTESRLQRRRAAYERRAPRLLFAGIGFEAAYQIELHPEAYPGLFVRESLKRVYPFGRAGSHILGYVGIINEREYDRLLKGGYLIEGLDEILGPEGAETLKKRGYLMDEMIGRCGVEKSCDALLRGKPGLAIVERDLERGTRSQVELCSATPGRDVTLTIDIEFQIKVEKALEESIHSCGAAVVTDPMTGEVLALASKPNFDPNDFVPPASRARVNAYFNDESLLTKPMLNRPLSGAYQLGSIFKVVVALAGLEEGKIEPGQQVDCNGYVEEGKRKFQCWIYREHHGATHGPLSLEGALERSCNVMFYTLGRELGLAGISKYARPLGFGERTGIRLPGESRGQYPYGPRFACWRSSDSMALAIGQSYLLVTPMQVAKAVGAIAARGRVIRPRILIDEPVDEMRIEGRHWDTVYAGMLKVTGGAAGTARGAGLQKWGVAGKTSSAQTVAGKNAHAWFAGFAPVDDPKICAVVLIEHGGRGGEAAAPVAAKIFEAFFTK